MTLKTEILQTSSAWRYYVNWQNTQIPFLHIHFSGKIKLILYPRVRNAITQLTILDICCIAFCRLTFREFLTDTQWKKVTPRNLHEMQRRNKQWNMKMGQIIDEVDFVLRFKYSGKATKISCLVFQIVWPLTIYVHLYPYNLVRCF